MVFWSKLRLLREEERFRKKIVEMATDFCMEAAVLISVLGILEAAIAWRGIPPFQDFAYSLVIGAAFVAIGCMIQVLEGLRRQAENATEEE